MATKIRLQRHGRRKSPFYHIVVANVTAPRDGKFIERLGTYNPTTVPAQITINVNKAVEWLQKGAQPTTTANAILRYKGVLYKKHLLRGVSKGSFTLEVAEQKFAEWQVSHEGAVMDHVKKIEESAASKKAAEVSRITNKRLEAASLKAAAEKEAQDAADAANAAAAVVETPEVEVAAEIEATPEVTAEETTPEVTAEVEATPEATTEETPNE